MLRLGARADHPRRSSPTCRTPSTCTSPPRRSTSTSGARGAAGGSSRCASTTTRPRRTCASAPATVADLTWKQMLDTFSCTECGRCQDVCPAYATGKALSPKLADHGPARPAVRGGPEPAGRAATATRRRRSCRTRSPRTSSGTASPAARACASARSSIEHVDHIVDLRRHLVMVESRFPAEAEPMLRDVERRQPVGQAAGRARRLGGRARRARARAGRPAAGGPVLGRLRGVVRRARARQRASRRRSCCRRRASTSPSSARASRCTGDPARRMGNEYLVPGVRRAERRDARTRPGVTKIVASCPHCFNTLGNEYPDFGGRYEVMHHTELLAELVREGRLQPRPTTRARSPTTTPATWRATTTCAREPRELVAAVGQPVEMERQRRAHVLLRRRRRAHVDGGARRRDQRGARARGGRDGRRDAGRRLPVLHGDARRRRALERRDMRVVDVATLLVQAVERRGAD